VAAGADMTPEAAEDMTPEEEVEEVTSLEVAEATSLGVVEDMTRDPAVDLTTLVRLTVMNLVTATVVVAEEAGHPMSLEGPTGVAAAAVVVKGPTIATVTLTPVAAVAAVTVVTTEAETAVMTAEVPPIPRTTAVAAAAAPRRTTLPPPTTTPGGLRRLTTGTGAETGAGHPWVARILGTEDQEDTVQAERPLLPRETTGVNTTARLCLGPAETQEAESLWVQAENSLDPPETVTAGETTVL